MHAESWDELDSDFDRDENQDDDGADAGVFEAEEFTRKRKIYHDPLAATPAKKRGRA